MEQIGGQNGKDMKQERRQDKEKRGKYGREIEQFGKERNIIDEGRIEKDMVQHE